MTCLSSGTFQGINDLSLSYTCACACATALNPVHDLLARQATHAQPQRRALAALCAYACLCAFACVFVCVCVCTRMHACMLLHVRTRMHACSCAWCICHSLQCMRTRGSGLVISQMAAPVTPANGVMQAIAVGEPEPTGSKSASR